MARSSTRTHLPVNRDWGSAACVDAEAGLRAPYVVVGLGNEIAGDDGVGIQVARVLRNMFRSRSDVDVVALPWAGFALLDVLRGRRTAALIDCLTTNRHPPGSVLRLDVSGFAGSVRLNSFHDISFPTAMSLGRAMGWEMPEEVAIWGVEAAAPDRFADALSPVVADAVPRVARAVVCFIDAHHGATARTVGVPS